ncbi:MAG: CDP-diacylglycerol--glycerol-3-phosphate 3-phosphatidyltransferase [Deferribacteraceae bacterium]|jgi:CDP-diacylglycerol--glycerol-3-phosphate 3-phosphatidyltransferase/cardiolipin synthase|nr:CDP-diacylglycerol--glycerol-3-phosphate 3-phosphatidyltransferase [Deferribacteraceae bacterium]
MLNLPNLLTILRILMVPAYLAVFYSDLQYANQIALVLFVAAALTDILDGYLARKYKLVTNLGKIMDPVADKILVATAMIALVDADRLVAWIAMAMLFRDFAVDALRSIAAAAGTVIAAGPWGKLKTLIQIFALSFLMFGDTLSLYPAFGISTLHASGIAIPAHLIGTILIYIALVASIFSGIVYYRQYFRFLKSSN